MRSVTASRRRLLIALLLPVLALRVLLPAGFMPVSDGGELRIVMCSEGMHLPDAGTGGDRPDGDDMGNCPFASASFNAPLPQFVVVAATPTLSARFISFAADDLPPSTGPPRAAAARAPPYHS
jgi:hypothetical protein